MSDIIKKYVYCVIFEKNAMGVSPRWTFSCLAPRYPTRTEWEELDLVFKGVPLDFSWHDC